ncbi:hypothetical protein PYCCODRAFT_1457021 [Trametes coccinea BRFM310]|uniref:INO80 complex subunit B-like conserved region domain-containing protein n=1 Tax=Trametes coccinea (strain BRFM310) TaxID=1353009 RepID=A0A1Y2J0Y7_TRAC3|nr:hypothetical protein PYCCODRAFT_1457021 [Trametes coccinea BRFM310]
MPPRRRIYDEESEEEEDVVSEPQSEAMEDELEMDVDEDQDQNEGDDIDVVGDGEHDDEGVVDDEDVVEEDIEDELADDVSDDQEAEIVAPRLKIKLKLPQAGPSSAATRSSANNTPSRASRRRPPRGSDIESEDDDEEEEDDDDDSTRSTSVATTAAGGRALTARQAVLRNVVDSSHVSLVEPPNPRKKKPLTEIEIALKREETARKRRNLTEKKLEDEKAETINRLLKKQSRARGKRNALSTAEDKPTPGENAPGEGDEEDVAEIAAPPPTMFRWISRAQPVQKTDKASGQESTAEERTVVFSFSVPADALPPTQGGDGTMQVDQTVAPPAAPQSTPSRCDVQGCTASRKYRLVRDFQKGACGLSHLKLLETQMA